MSEMAMGGSECKTEVVYTAGFAGDIPAPQHDIGTSAEITVPATDGPLSDYIRAQSAHAETSPLLLSKPTHGYNDLLITARELVHGMGLSREVANNILTGLAMREIVVPGTDSSDESSEDSIASKEEEWEVAMGRLHERVEALGTKGFAKACEAGNYTSPDVFSVAQLERMARLATGAALPRDDLTLGLVDVVADHSGGIVEELPEFDDNDGTTYMAEMSYLGDLYRVPVTLASRYGLVASTVVVLAHSDEMGLMVGKEEEFVGLPPLVRSKDYALERAQIRRFTHEYIRPHSVTGERSLVLGGCAPARENRATFTSPAEVIASQTDPRDRVVVSGSRAYIASVVRLDMSAPDDYALVEPYVAQRNIAVPDNGELVCFWDTEADKPVLTYMFRRTADGLQRSYQLGMPGVR